VAGVVAFARSAQYHNLSAVTVKRKSIRRATGARGLAIHMKTAKPSAF
jgi:hypothetical protein